MADQIPGFQYLPGDRTTPHHELQVVTAVPFVKVSDNPRIHQEGIVFDRNRDIYLTDIHNARVIKVDMKTKDVTIAYEIEDKKSLLAAVKFHKDGRIFMACVDMTPGAVGAHGGIFAVQPDGTGFTKILEGVNVDDLVFDTEGGIYYTNYIGTPADRCGAIEYLSPDFKERKVIVGNLASPNGVTLSPDGKILWFTETNAGVLHRYPVADPMHYTTPYYFEGFLGPDSCEVDGDGNLYVAMARQGQILVFNPNGFLIGKIITKACKEDKLMGTTHAVVHPDNKELYFCVHDDRGDVDDSHGGMIYTCGAFAKGFDGSYQFL